MSIQTQFPTRREAPRASPESTLQWWALPEAEAFRRVLLSRLESRRDFLEQGDPTDPARQRDLLRVQGECAFIRELLHDDFKKELTKP